MVRVGVRVRVSVRVRVRFRVRARVRVRVRVRVSVSVRKILRVNMVSRTGRNEKHVREDINSKYGFPYWKKLNTGMGSRTGRMKNGYGKILRADMVFRTKRN